MCNQVSSNRLSQKIAHLIPSHEFEGEVNRLVFPIIIDEVSGYTNERIPVPFSGPDIMDQGELAFVVLDIYIYCQCQIIHRINKQNNLHILKR